MAVSFISTTIDVIAHHQIHFQRYHDGGSRSSWLLLGQWSLKTHG